MPFPEAKGKDGLIPTAPSFLIQYRRARFGRIVLFDPSTRRDQCRTMSLLT